MASRLNQAKVSVTRTEQTAIERAKLLARALIADPTGNHRDKIQAYVESVGALNEARKDVINTFLIERGSPALVRLIVSETETEQSPMTLIIDTRVGA